MMARSRAWHAIRALRPWRILALVLVVVALAGAPGPAAAWTPGQPLTLGFPRLCLWWPNADIQSAADIARFDYVVLQDSEASHIDALRALDPDIIVLDSMSCNELDYDGDRPASDPRNARLVAASAQWILTQVGSTLTADVDAATTTLQMAAVTATSGLTLFKAGDLVVMGEEIAQVEAVGASTLTVRRGFVKRPSSHAAGTRVAATISMWPGAMGCDLSTYCPRVTVDPAVGPETFAEWNARTGAALIAASDWDGIVLDRGDGNQSWVVGAGIARSIDPDRSNTVPGSYADFDAAWNTGMRAFEERMRSLVGDGRVILVNNGVVDGSVLNGSNLEAFPKDNTTASGWHTMVFGPRLAPSGAYLDWLSQSRQPNLSALQTYEFDDLTLADDPFGMPGWHPDYRKMRFGLTTALLGDGFFTYEMSTAGHGSLGLMWFDEYDNAGKGRGYLGQPLGPARRALPAPTTPDLLGGDGSFDTTGQLATWSLADHPGDAATLTGENGTARVDITAVRGLQWDLSLVHPVPLHAGSTYTLSFRARADRPVDLGLWLHEWPDGLVWSNIDSIPIDETWRTYELPCTSSGTDAAAALMLRMGETVGTVWLDDVRFQLTTDPRPDVWRRDFEGGIALVNPTDSADTVSLGGTFRKIRGKQDPKVNSGATVSSVSVPARDGVILLRIPTVSLRASATVITYGGATRFSVAVAPASAGTVRLETRAAGGSAWKLSTTLSLDGSGTAHMERSPGSNMEYRATLVGAGVVSGTVKIGVRPVLTLRVSKAVVRRGHTVVLSGAVSHSGKVSVLLQRRVGSSWRTERRRVTSRSGRFSTTVALKRRGTFWYRVRVGADPSHLAAVSATASVFVR
jgi:hypothetical protein